MVSAVILVLISILLNKLALKLIPDLLIASKSVAKNYQGKEVPVGYGLIFVLNIVIILIIGVLLGDYQVREVNKLLILILVMGFVGFLDDMLGNKSSQGFSGHFRTLLVEGELTTGAIKAIFSLCIVLFINLYWFQGWLNIFINTAIVLLTTNFINLLDLRPGRALKVVIIFLIIILLSAQNTLLTIPILITVLFYLPYDLKAEGMMGDIGSNVLGVIVGFLLIFTFSLYTKVIIVLTLIIIHLYAEFYSLSKLIKSNKILSYFDEIGRK